MVRTILVDDNPAGNAEQQKATARALRKAKVLPICQYCGKTIYWNPELKRWFHSDSYQAGCVGRACFAQPSVIMEAG